jgi:arylsulfatase A-like enzyme
VLLLAAFPCSCSLGPGAPRHRYQDVVVVTVDTLRADHLGCYGYPRPTSPFLDELATRSVRFEDALSASSHTGPSHASLFTSLYPEQHRVLVNGVVLDKGIASMAELFRENAHATAGFVGVGFLASLDHGFETLDAEMPPKQRYRPAAEVVDRAVAWLQGLPHARPFFLWVHVYDVHEHGPQVVVPEPYLSLMRDDSKRRGESLLQYLREHHGLSAPELHGNFDRYDGQLAFVDAQLRRLYRAVERLAGRRPALWVITADHGEGLGNHGYMGHGKHLYAEQLRVPLLFCGGNDLAPRVVPDMVRLVDVLPTVAELAGLSWTPATLRLEGRSLVPLLDGTGPVPVGHSFAQRRPADERRSDLGWAGGRMIAAQDRRYKYIHRQDAPDELYDLERDPHELHNLIDEDRPEGRALGRWLERKDQELRHDPRGGARSLEIEDRYIDELKALGYLSSGSGNRGQGSGRDTPESEP